MGANETVIARTLGTLVALGALACGSTTSQLVRPRAPAPASVTVQPEPEPAPARASGVPVSQALPRDVALRGRHGELALADERWLLISARGELAILDLFTGRVQGRAPCNCYGDVLAFDEQRRYALCAGRGWCAWDLVSDEALAVPGGELTALDERSGRVLRVARSGEVSLHSLRGERLAGAVDTEFTAPAYGAAEPYLALAGARSRWVLADERAIEIRDASTLALVARVPTPPELLAVHASPDADVFFVETWRGLEVLSATTGERLTHIDPPRRGFRSRRPFHDPGVGTLLVGWEAFFENEDEEMWWEHDVRRYDARSGRALGEAGGDSDALSYFEPRGPVVRYGTDGQHFEWEPGSERREVSTPGGWPLVDGEGRVLAWVELDEDETAIEIVREDGSSSIPLGPDARGPLHRAARSVLGAELRTPVP